MTGDGMQPARDGKGPADSKRVDCYQCRYLSITYQQDKPFACALFSMRSRLLPSIQVQRSSGSPCAGFEEKQARR